MQECISGLMDALFGGIAGKCDSGHPVLPSFSYKGIPFEAGNWSRDVVQSAAESGYEKYIVTYLSPDSLLRLKLVYTIYSDFPVVEFVPFLEAAGSVDTGLVDSFRSLHIDITIPESARKLSADGFKLKLRRFWGAEGRLDDFLPADTWITERHPCRHVVMDTDVASSSRAWLPFFGLDFDENYGFNAAIGWAGEWSAEFLLQAGRLDIHAGMMHTHFRLRPGESIRQPSVFIMLRDGMPIQECVNLQRWFMRQYHSPLGLEATQFLPFECLAMPNNCSVDKAKAVLDSLNAPNPFNVFSTYNCNSAQDALAYPEGIADIVEKSHALNMKFLLNIELEKCSDKAQVLKNHPGMFLKNPARPDTFLLDFGNEGARQLAMGLIRYLAEDCGVDFCCFGFSENALPFWRASDASERQGIAEAKYVGGIYEFLDEIRRLFPNMLVDCNAGTGRLLDFETVSRCVAMSCSDSMKSASADIWNAGLSQFTSLAQCIPFFGICVSAAALSMQTRTDAMKCVYPMHTVVYDEKLPSAIAGERMSVAGKMQGYFDADFYLLADGSPSCNGIVAYQKHDPMGDCGFIAAFANGTDVSTCLKLAGISPRSVYVIEEDGVTSQEIKGSDLLKQIYVFSEKQSAHVVFYGRVKKTKK